MLTISGKLTESARLIVLLFQRMNSRVHTLVVDEAYNTLSQKSVFYAPPTVSFARFLPLIYHQILDLLVKYSIRAGL